MDSKKIQRTYYTGKIIFFYLHVMLPKLSVIKIREFYDTPCIFIRVRACIIIVTLLFFRRLVIHFMHTGGGTDGKVVSRDNWFADEMVNERERTKLVEKAQGGGRGEEYVRIRD